MKKLFIIGTLLFVGSTSMNASTPKLKMLKNSISSCQNEAISMGNEMVGCGMSQQVAIKHAFNYYLDCVNSI